MKMIIENNRATVDKVDRRIYLAATTLEGSRRILKTGGYSFEPTRHNLEQFQKMFPECEVEDRREKAPEVGEVTDAILQSFHPGRPQRKYQTAAIKKLLPLRGGALFMEQGTGKTKVGIDLAGLRYVARQITGVLIVTLKGVNYQWIDEEVPKDIGEGIPWRGFVWKGSKVPEIMFNRNRLSFFAMNVDGMRSKRAIEAMDQFIDAHQRVMIIFDESSAFKDPNSKRSKNAQRIAMKVRKLGGFVIIQDGTPILKNLVDLFGQFKLVDPDIIGHQYVTTFRAQFCNTIDGPMGVQIVGHKNVEQLYARIDPHTYRVRKDEVLDLPPKVYAEEMFELTDEQRHHYDELKALFLTKLDNGEIASVDNAAVLWLRLQQIASGHLEMDDGSMMALDNARLPALRKVVERREGKGIIWSRFNDDLQDIFDAPWWDGGQVGWYHGKDHEARETQREWLDPNSKMDWLLINPARGAAGLNLQGHTRTNIYYANSFNARHRWQSEDRTHRDGMLFPVTYIDLIARKTVDKSITRNLAQKQGLADLTLDHIRKMLTEGDDE